VLDEVGPIALDAFDHLDLAVVASSTLRGWAGTDLSA
jgi:hypothetical protein